MSNFRFHMPLTVWEKSGSEHPMRIGGIVSTDALDKQSERIVQDGLDFSPFLTSGWFNDNHSRSSSGVVGYPSGATRVKKGDILPNGQASTHNGWWADGYLLDTKKGRELYEIATAVQKTEGGRQLGFSIEGKVSKRDAKDPSTILRAQVKHVAVTHCPVNTDTELHVLAKAMTAGSAVDAPPVSPGEGFALRQESMDGDKPSTTDEPDEDEEIAALSSANAPIAKSDHGGGSIPFVSEIEHIEAWADTLASFAPSDRRLNKSEAALIVRARYPHLDAAAIDRVVQQAAGGL